MDIRQAHPSDDEGIVRLILARCPQLNRAIVEGPVTDPATVEDRTLLVAHDPTDAAAPAGVGLQYHGIGITPGRLLRQVVVAEDALGTGLGGRLLRELDAALPADAVATSGEIHDTDRHALAVAEHWGYRILQHSVTARLDLADVGHPTLPGGLSAESSPGLTFADEAAVEEMLAASQTNPEVEHTGVLGLASLRSMAAPDGAVRPVGVVLRDAGRPVALSYALVAEGQAQLVYTGVRPDARGRGLAALTKQALHAEAARAGAAYAVTDNEDENAGIRAVNAALGYRRVSGSYWVTRDCGA